MAWSLLSNQQASEETLVCSQGPDFSPNITLPYITIPMDSVALTQQTLSTFKQALARCFPGKESITTLQKSANQGEMTAQCHPDHALPSGGLYASSPQRTRIPSQESAGILGCTQISTNPRRPASFTGPCFLLPWIEDKLKTLYQNVEGPGWRPNQQCLRAQIQISPQKKKSVVSQALVILSLAKRHQRCQRQAVLRSLPVQLKQGATGSETDLASKKKKKKKGWREVKSDLQRHMKSTCTCVHICVICACVCEYHKNKRPKL